jgi:hypothetical protein
MLCLPYILHLDECAGAIQCILETELHHVVILEFNLSRLKYE